MEVPDKQSSMRGKTAGVKEAKQNAQSALLVEKPKLVAEFRDDELDNELS